MTGLWDFSWNVNCYCNRVPQANNCFPARYNCATPWFTLFKSVVSSSPSPMNSSACLLLKLISIHPELYSQRAAEIISSHQLQDSPYFLYVSLTLVHAPFQVCSGRLSLSLLLLQTTDSTDQAPVEPSRGVRNSMLVAMDAAVGTIRCVYNWYIMVKSDTCKLFTDVKR